MAAAPPQQWEVTGQEGIPKGGDPMLENEAQELSGPRTSTGMGMVSYTIIVLQFLTLSCHTQVRVTRPHSLSQTLALTR